MKETEIGKIVKAISGELLRGDVNDTVKNVSIDTRKTCESCIFFALQGENHDAHDFLADAVQNGATCIVVSTDGKLPAEESVSVIKVSDTTKALQDLAKWYLECLKIKKIGITGSTGKTTTKDILYHICAEKYKTGKTTGNFNNHIGVPLTIFSFDDDTEVGILEMGTESAGEIHTLVDIVRPDIAVITNIGTSHMETFGNRENILKGKMEITDFLPDTGLLVVNEACDMLTKENVSGNYRLTTVGTDGRSSYILGDIETSADNGIIFTLEYMEEIKKIKLNIPGRHNAINATLAIAAAADLGISMEEAGRGLQNVVLTEKRLNIQGKNGIKVIDDTYNASPASVKAAIEVLVSTKGMRKVAILGDMLGLGENAVSFHEEIGEYAAQKDIDMLIFTGALSIHMYEKAKEIIGAERTLHYSVRGKLEADINMLVVPGDVVLVKGSRAMAMEHIVKKIWENLE